MRSYGIGRVFQRKGSSRWWIKYSYRGTVHEESSGSRKRQDAVGLLKKRLGEMQAGTFGGAKAARLTVAELLAASLEEMRARRMASVRNYTRYHQRIGDAIGHVRAADLTSERLWRLVEAWRAEGLADATINRHMEALSRAYRYGASCTPPLVSGRFVTIPSLTENNARTGYVSRADFEATHAELVQRDPVVADLIEWCWWTGMRWGAVSRLTWSAVDRETKTFTVPGSVQKNKRPVKFPLVAPLWAIIERCHRRCVEAGMMPGLLFWRVYDGHPRKGLRRGDATRVVDFRKVFASACDAAGVGRWIVHDLRRTALRNLRRAGVDRRTAMLISGHRTEATFERYLIDRDQEVGGALEQAMRYVDRLPNCPNSVSKS